MTAVELAATLSILVLCTFAVLSPRGDRGFRRDPRQRQTRRRRGRGGGRRATDLEVAPGFESKKGAAYR